MSRQIGTALVVLTALAASVTAGAAPQGTPTLLALYDAYAAGDYTAIPRAFSDSASFDAGRRDLQQTLRLWQKTWRPSQAAFLLELSFAAFERQWDDASELLGGTRNVVLSRPAPPGRNADEDAFELAFHRAAITFFIGRQRLDFADAYLTALAGRVDLVPATSGKPRLVDPWMTFARGMISEITTAPAMRQDAANSDATSTLTMAAGDAAGRSQAELAITAYDRVAAFPDVAAEAAVRRGFLHWRLGRPAEALAAFAEADAAAGDQSVRYWSELFRGRTLDGMNQPADAAAAYERASAMFPSAPTPVVALASLWQRHDRPGDAVKWARAAMNRPRGGLDPWWLYWRGDIRHSDARLAALRRGRP
jgi:tetratricopeptide (TPR) repeat protein